VRWALWSSFSPSQVIVLLPVLGAMLLAAGRQRAGRVLCVAGGAALLAFGVLPLSHPLVSVLERRFPPPVLPARVTGILLLAGAERPYATQVSGEPQLNRHGSRYATALRLAHRHPEARLVVVGGPFRDPVSGRLDQSGVARMLLAGSGLDPRRVSFETRATDTCDSAASVEALVRPAAGDAWVLVTSAVHLPRSVGCFRAAGWEVIPLGADRQVVPGDWNVGTFRAAENLALLDLALHEWLGLAYYRAVGRIGTLFPGP
jgi:uncharacterized SAM-binding protein YcdF (DUF218 family)